MGIFQKRSTHSLLQSVVAASVDIATVAGIATGWSAHSCATETKVDHVVHTGYTKLLFVEQLQMPRADMQLLCHFADGPWKFRGVISDPEYCHNLMQLLTWETSLWTGASRSCNHARAEACTDQSDGNDNAVIAQLRA